MLEGITKANKLFTPQKIVAYGVEGLGKTVFASTFEAPILIPIEEGAGAIDIDTFPLCPNYDAVVNCINALHGEHNFKTVVVDSLDWLEPLVWAATCAHYSKESIESFGFGKGYKEATTWWMNLLSGFDSLRARKGMTVVLIAHSHIKRFESPETDAYDQYKLKLQERAEGLFKEWSDMLLFLNYKVAVKKDNTAGIGGEKTKGIGTGDRVIYTAQRPAYHAKNRWGLPEEIFIGKDKSWNAFHAALESATEGRYKNPNDKGAKK